jgi:hypothetical protein
MNTLLEVIQKKEIEQLKGYIRELREVIDTGKHNPQKIDSNWLKRAISIMKKTENLSSNV